MSKFPNKKISTEKSAKSVEEAVSEALTELDINKENAVIEVVQEPSKGFLGLGAKEAVVKVSVKSDDVTVQAEPVAAVEVKDAVTAVNSGKYRSESAVDNAKNFISDVLSAMGLDVTVTAVLEEDIIKINLEGENMGIVIGKRGDTLDSLQYLTSLVVNLNSKDYIKVSIDTENYREKRSEALIALSNRLAEKVTASGKKFALEPMNPYERRIIHANLQDSETVTTFSVGQEPYRKVVIAPKNPKNYSGKRGYGKGKGKHDGSNRGYGRQGYAKQENKPATAASTATYKADFKPQQHKAEYKNFEEYLAAHTKSED